MMQEQNNSLVHAFLRTTEAFNDRPMIHFKEDRQWKILTYSDYRNRVLSLTAFLQGAGMSPGDRIAVISNNRPEWIISDMGILAGGYVTVPVYPTLKEEQIQYILNQSGCRGILFENRDQMEKLSKIVGNLPTVEFLVTFDPVGIELNDHLFSFAEVLERGSARFELNRDIILRNAEGLSRKDLASIVYTSGTTGNPKGVMLTHGNFLSNAESILTLYDITEADIILSILPLSHVLERLGSFFACVTVAGSQYAFVESLETVADDMAVIRPTLFIAVPRLFEKIHAKIMNQVQDSSRLKKKIFRWAVRTGGRWQQENRDGSVGIVSVYLNKLAFSLVHRKIQEKFGGRLRAVISGGAPLESHINQFFVSVGIPLREGYGLTETSPVTHLNTLSEYRIGSAGKVIPSVEMKLDDDGEILVRGPNVTSGYYDNPEATAEVFTEDGWFRTGDIGKTDQDGFLWITDRKKEILVTSGGKNVAPQPIENLLKQCPLVSQVMILGEKRNFVSALIVPDMEQVRSWAEKQGLKDTPTDELLANSEFRKTLDNQLETVVSSLPRYEQIKKYLLLEEPWTVDSGELTPTMKLKRRVILANNAERIETLYRG